MPPGARLTAAHLVAPSDARRGLEVSPRGRGTAWATSHLDCRHGSMHDAKQLFAPVGRDRSWRCNLEPTGVLAHGRRGSASDGSPSCVRQPTG